jgi:hypothetical protein
VKDGQKLVVVTSTWGPRSLLGQCSDLLPRLVDELPSDEYRIAAIVHPNTWYWHGHWQVRAWYADCMRAGLALVPPEEGWQATLAAADMVIGDHGSVTHYAASIGVPVLLAAFPEESIAPDSHVAVLGRVAARVNTTLPLLPQLSEAAAMHRRDSYSAVTRLITSVPAQAGRIIRQVMYQLMELPEPLTPPELRPVPVPKPLIVSETFGGEL